MQIPIVKLNNQPNFARIAKAKKRAIKKAASVPALTIIKKGAEKLSPNRSAFNKLTARIEKLRNEITRKEGQLEEAIMLYGQAIPPLRSRTTSATPPVAIAGMAVLPEKKLPKAAQPYLKDMLQQLISEVLQNSDEEPDEELKAIFLELERDKSHMLYHPCIMFS